MLCGCACSACSSCKWRKESWVTRSTAPLRLLCCWPPTPVRPSTMTTTLPRRSPTTVSYRRGQHPLPFLSSRHEVGIPISVKWDLRSGQKNVSDLFASWRYSNWWYWDSPQSAWRYSNWRHWDSSQSEKRWGSFPSWLSKHSRCSHCTPVKSRHWTHSTHMSHKPTHTQKQCKKVYRHW